ncbi:MAG: PEP/pyruvate-binding domain-containing protein [Candidatus Campbellbacteria bacterium]|nr:PEP/pyruvate-binding domain-containing protein [Candidatus Campbellbacteria bacterium]
MIKLSQELPKKAGGKAQRLAELYQAGFSVPCGVVVLPNEEITQCAIEAGLQECQAHTYAVRSSFALEDGESHSFAGIFESETEVPKQQLTEAVKRVRASADTERAKQYGSLANVTISSDCMSVVIQEMVVADIYGVCFTKAPNEQDQMLISVSKHHEGVTGGENSETHKLARVGGTLHPIYALVRDAALNIERLFGAPQDIEYAIQDIDGSPVLVVLQSRPITS